MDCDKNCRNYKQNFSGGSKLKKRYQWKNRRSVISCLIPGTNIIEIFMVIIYKCS
jgi:hypothetical protein